MLWKKLRSKTEAQALLHTALHTDSLCAGTRSTKPCLLPNTSQESSSHSSAAFLALPRQSAFPIRLSGAAINTDQWEQHRAFICRTNAWFPCWLFANTAPKQLCFFFYLGQTAIIPRRHFEKCYIGLSLFHQRINKSRSRLGWLDFDKALWKIFCICAWVDLCPHLCTGPPVEIRERCQASCSILPLNPLIKSSREQGW